MSFIKAIATVSSLTLASRVLGFLRDVLMASFLGAGIMADAFFVALKLPNFFRRITAEGAMSIAFIPIFSETFEKEGQDKAQDYASQMLSFLFSFLMPLSIVIIAAMPWVILGLFPGFEGRGLRYEWAVELSRITFPYLLLMSLTALIGGILNARDRFAPFAAAPIIFNLCLIGALLLHSFISMSAAEMLSYAVLVSGFVQLFWVWWFLNRTGFKIRILLPKITPRIKRTFTLMIPAILGAGVMHINLLVDMILASFLPVGSISYLYYADRLAQLPLGVIGIAVGTALLPMLSKTIASEDGVQSKALFQQALTFSFLFSLPACLALMTIAYPVIYTLFVHGAFSVSDGQIAAHVLIAYALGMPAYIACKCYSTLFYAHQDTRSPLIIASISAACNIVLSLILINYLGVVGIALATGIAGWIQISLLYHRARLISVSHMPRTLWINVFKMLISAMIMSLGLYMLSAHILGWSDLSIFQRIVSLFISVLCGLIIYTGLIMLLRVVHISDLKLLAKPKA
jgi:putative peptidoglycan lipid II flippase